MTVSKFGKSRCVGKVAIFVLLCISVVVQVSAEPSEIDLDRLITSLREQVMTSLTTSGSVRYENLDTRFSSKVEGQSIVIEIPSASRRFKIPLQGGFAVTEIRPGNSRILTSAEVKAIFGPAVVELEDLTFRFLFWSYKRDGANQNIRNMECVPVRFVAPGQNGETSAILVWVAPRYCTPMRISMLDKGGAEKKRFDVQSFTHSEKEWSIRSIRVMDMKARTISYLDFDNPK